MEFDSSRYGSGVARALALDDNGRRLLPLTCGTPHPPEARALLNSFRAAEIFPDARDAQAAMAGLWLYFSCFEEAHALADANPSAEGALWHAILHRQEPDSGNAAYWFRRAGRHAIFADLAREAAAILERLPGAEFRVGRWDPFAFIAFCDRARVQPGSRQEQAAREIQRAEWQLLFDYCARPRS
jgi:hypothetical protein